MSDPNLNQNGSGSPALEAKPCESVSLVGFAVTKGNLTVEGNINTSVTIGNEVGNDSTGASLRIDVDNIILKDTSQSKFSAPVYINTFQDNREPSEKVTKITTDQCPKSLFTGREELLEEIHESVLACSTNDRERLDFDWEARIIVLVGLGGIGKSEVTRKYAQNFTNVAWIASENLTSLTTSFISVAKELKLYQYDELMKTVLAKKLQDITEDETKDIVQAVYNHFSKFVKTGIFIFDNAQQMNSLECEFGIFDFLPKNNVQPYPVVLITSRNQNWQLPKSNNKIQVPELSHTESVAFLKKALKAQLAEISSTDEAVAHDLLSDLATKLRGHALALTLAAANISKITWANLPQEIKKYIEIFNKPDGTWIEDKHLSGEPTKYDLIMKNVWSSSVEKVQNSQYGQVAMKLLYLIAYLPTDGLTTSEVDDAFIGAQKKKWSVQGINSVSNNNIGCIALRCLTTSVSELTNHDDEDICRAYGVLETYSMLTVYKYKAESYHSYNKIRIHRLVQKCTRDRLEQSRDHTYLMLVLEQVTTPLLGIIDFESGILIHSFVHERKSPLKSVKRSILIACHLVIRSIFNYAFPVLMDIYEYLQTSGAHYTPNKYYLNLFHLCLLRCRNLYSGDKIYRTGQFSNGKLDKCLVTGARILLNREMYAHRQVEVSHYYRKRLLSLIGRYEPHSDSECLYVAKKEMNKVILAAVNLRSTSSLRYELYQILWGLPLMNSPGDSARHISVNAICKNYFKLFNVLDHKSIIQVADYWMQLIQNLDDIGSEKVGGSAWRAALIWSFVHDGGLHLLVQLTTNYFQQDWLSDSCITLHINFIYALAFEGKELASHIIKCKEVMEMLKQVTTAAILDDSGKLTVCQTGKYNILIPWFALFARNSTQDGTSEWSIHSVDSEMEAWLKTLPSEDKEIDETIQLFAGHRPILETFLRSTQRFCVDATVAREIAQRLLLGMKFKEVESERRIKLRELQFSV